MVKFYNDDNNDNPGFDKKTSTHFTYTDSDGHLIVSHDNKMPNGVEWLTIKLKESIDPVLGVRCDIIGLNLQDGIGDENYYTPIKYNPDFTSTFYMPTHCTNTELHYPHEIPSKQQIYRHIELAPWELNPPVQFWDVQSKQNRHTLIFAESLLQTDICVKNGEDVFDPKLNGLYKCCDYVKEVDGKYICNPDHNDYKTPECCSSGSCENALKFLCNTPY